MNDKIKIIWSHYLKHTCIISIIMAQNRAFNEIQTSAASYLLALFEINKIHLYIWILFKRVLVLFFKHRFYYKPKYSIKFFISVTSWDIVGSVTWRAPLTLSTDTLRPWHSVVWHSPGKRGRRQCDISGIG